MRSWRKAIRMPSATWSWARRRDAVRAIGNLKYDAEPSHAEPPRIIAELIEKLHPATIWIAASTMAGVDRDDVDEDDAVLQRFSGTGAEPAPASC